MSLQTMHPGNLTGQVTLLEQHQFLVGHYSDVYQGFYRDEKVAVRVFRAVNRAPPTPMRKKIRLELERLARIHHPNIQGFYGFAWDERFSPYGALISPWRAVTSVSHVLSEQSQLWSTQRRIDLWKDVISGVNYLHSQNPPVVHGDIRAGKVILNELGQAVLCDPGLFGILLAEGSYKMVKTKDTGDARYLAPELVKEDQTAYPTRDTDVYALGWLGFEFIFDGKAHLYPINNSQAHITAEASGIVPVGESNEVECLAPTPWKLIQACWNSVPTKRPSVFQMMERLNAPRVHLPHDVLFLIFVEAADMPPPFDHLSHLEGDHWTYLRQEYNDKWLESLGILANLCRVSKEWHEAAVPLLYQQMRLKLERQISSAATTLEYSHHNPCPWIGVPYGLFVKVLYIGNRRESHPVMHSARLIADLQSLVMYTPNLRSYHTSTWLNTTANKLSNSYYSSRIVPNLLKNGSNLTALEISDHKFVLTDINRLVNGLPALERFTVSSMLMWELETTRNRTSSDSLRTLVIIEPDGAGFGAMCLYGHIFDAMATWNMPNLHTVLIHDCCSVLQVLGNMAPFFSAHQSKIQLIVFRRWVIPYSDNDTLLFRSKFPEFTNRHFTQNSVRFWKV